MYKFTSDMSIRIENARLSALKHRTHQAWLKVVSIIKRRRFALEAIYMLQRIREQNPYWVDTDDMGSGFDTRYTHISYMDTR